MRILQLHNLQGASGGAIDVVQQEARLLSGAGHHVDQLLEPSAEDSGMNAGAMGLAAVWNRGAGRRLMDKIEQFDPDVVHVHTPFPLQSPAVFRYAHRMGRPTVTTVHAYRYSCIVGTCLRDGHACEDCVGTQFKLAGIRHRCYHDSIGASTALTLSLVGHRAIGTFSRHVDRFITVTPFAKDLLVRDGVPAGHIVVKPNAVADPGTPLPSSLRSPYALFVGRLVEEKGIRTLLTAWRNVAGLALYIAGDGPLRDLVEKESATNPALRQLGWCDPTKLIELQSRATLTVVPSEWYEAGPPLVMLQALAAGTPVLASDIPNICSSLVESGAGRTFASRDPSDLADAATQMFRDAEGREVMGMNGRALYEREHTFARAVESLEAIYRTVIATRVHKSPTSGTPGGE
jgi:glycosyltransferase involved in cell wall biosynthesis